MEVASARAVEAQEPEDRGRTEKKEMGNVQIEASHLLSVSPSPLRTSFLPTSSFSERPPH